MLTKLPRRFPHISPTARRFKLGTFKTLDSNIDTDEILTENNPWSPTLYTDIVKVKPKGYFLRAVALPSNFRLSYLTLYEAPGLKYVSLLRRLTVSFAVLGAYGAKLFWELVQFEDIYAIGCFLATLTPAAFVQFKTRDYVTRIFRLYDKDQPQTVENLTTNERLVMEKLSPMGSRTYNELLHMDNDSLKLVEKHGSLLPMATWKEIDPELGRKRKYYVVDNIGGIKMDRLWGIVEKNLGVNHGRYIDDERKG